MVTPWQKIKEEPYSLAYRKVVKRTYKLPNGMKHDYDIVVSRPVAVIIALTPKNTVLIAQEFRPGQEKVLMELPAGQVDEGESPEQAAKRELLEETGYSGELEYLGSAYRDAYATVVLHTFLARNSQKIQEPVLGPGEFIEVSEMTPAEFVAHVRSGQLTDVGPAYMALDRLGWLCGGHPAESVATK